MSQRSDELGVRRGASRSDSAHHGWALPPLRSGFDRGVGKEPRAGTDVMSAGTTAWCPTKRLTAHLQGVFVPSTNWSTDASLLSVLLFARTRQRT
jgi:hypothetical protein